MRAKHWTGILLIAVMALAVLLALSSSPTSSPTWRKVVAIRGTLPEGIVEVEKFLNPSGIENIYIMKHGADYDPNTNLVQYVGDTNYCVAVITGPGQTVSVPYELPLDFVVAVRGEATLGELAYARKENIKVEFEWSGGYYYRENSTDLMEYVFDNYLYGGSWPDGAWVRINAVFDNNGYGWTLPAGGYANYAVTLYTWG